MWVLNPRPGDFFLALSPLDQHAKGQSAQAEIKRYMSSIAMQYDLRYRRLSRPQWLMGESSPRAFSAKADQMHETAAAAPMLVPCAWVRAPCIEGPAPSTALCEAPTSSARSAASLGVITAGQRRDLARFGTLSATSLDGCPRWGWHVSASGWCEKHPIIVAEP